MSTGAGRVGFCQFKAVAIGIVFTVDSNQCRHTKAAKVLFAHFGAGALRRHHNDGNVIAHLHAFFDDVESVRVREASAVLHERLNRGHDVGVLLVRCEVEYHVRLRNKLLVGADFKAVLRRTQERGALLSNG